MNKLTTRLQASSFCVSTTAQSAHSESHSRRLRVWKPLLVRGDPCIAQAYLFGKVNENSAGKVSVPLAPISPASTHG